MSIPMMATTIIVPTATRGDGAASGLPASEDVGEAGRVGLGRDRGVRVREGADRMAEGGLDLRLEKGERV